MYGFPNSVEVAWRGKKEFFASFLKRDAAYRLLTYAWSKSRCAALSLRTGISICYAISSLESHRVLSMQSICQTLRRPFRR